MSNETKIIIDLALTDDEGNPLDLPTLGNMTDELGAQHTLKTAHAEGLPDDTDATGLSKHFIAKHQAQIGTDNKI